MIRVKNLTESLEKKCLLEKYSDSMPDWLQHRLDYIQNANRGYNIDSLYPALKSDDQTDINKDEITGDHKLRQNAWMGNNSSRDKAYKIRDKYGYERPYYQYRGSSNDWEDQSNSLYYNFRRMGIPLDKVKVVEGPLPTKRTDERLKEPNIPIFLFDNGQVYAKGVNDNERYMDSTDERPFKYLPMKDLLSEPVAFAYIDGNDSSNFNALDVRAKRQKEENRDWRKYARAQSKGVSDEGKILPGFDKSGYPVPLDKWKKSNQSYLSKYKEKQIEAYRERLINAIDDYKVFQNIMVDALKDTHHNIPRVGYYSGRYAYDINDVDYRDRSGIKENLLEARYYYSRVLEAIKDMNDEEFDSNLTEMTDSLIDFEKALEKTGVMPEKLAVIDWI